MLKRLFHTCLILSVVFIPVSCQKEETGTQAHEGRVLLFYMAVDEVNISFDWYDKIEAILDGAKGVPGDILIYCDTERSAPLLQCVRINKNGQAALETVEEFAEENSTSPIVLRRTIDRMRQMYPDRHYGLVVFTHSSGWLPAGTLLDPLSDTRSIGIDDHPGGNQSGRAEMELDDFSRTIPDGLFDFIIFESCLTANVEVAYELRNKTPYILASVAEIVSPGFDPVYKTHLQILMDLRHPTQQALCDFATAFYREAKNSEKYDHSATIGVIATAQMDGLAGVVREILADPASDAGPSDDIQYFDRYQMYRHPSYPRFFDLEEYIERIASEKQFAEFKAVLDKTMVCREATATFLWRYQGFLIRRHCGLTTYIEHPEYEQGRINVAWRNTSWWRKINS